MNRIFKEQYGSGKKAKPDSGPFLYRIFKKFEEHRLDAVSRLVDGDNIRVLDVGFCDGEFLLRNNSKWNSVVGVDVVPDLIKNPRLKKLSVPAKFFVMDLGRERIRSHLGTFDLVVVIGTLQLIYDIDLFLDNIHKIIKPNGQLIIEVPNSVVFWRRLQFLLGKFPRTSCYSNGWDGGVIHFFTQSSLTSYLKKYGFEVKQVTCSGILSKPRSIWPSLLGGDLIFDCRKT